MSDKKRATRNKGDNWAKYLSSLPAAFAQLAKITRAATLFYFKTERNLAALQNIFTICRPANEVANEVVYIIAIF